MFPAVEKAVYFLLLKALLGSDYLLELNRALLIVLKCFKINENDNIMVGKNLKLFDYGVLKFLKFILVNTYLYQQMAFNIAWDITSESIIRDCLMNLFQFSVK